MDKPSDAILILNVPFLCLARFQINVGKIRQLKVRLLQRSTRSLRPTGVGERYYSRCQQILEAYEDAKMEAGDAQATLNGVIRVAAPSTFGAMQRDCLRLLRGG